MRVVEEGNSEGKDGTKTVKLQSHEKSGRGRGALSPRYSPQASLPTLPMLYSALLRVQHAQKRHAKVEGGEGRDVN